MTDELYLVGTLEELYPILTNILRVIENRAALGYRLLLDSIEAWEYKTRDDGRVCPICKPMHDWIFSGDIVRDNFPNLEFLGRGIIFPDTHRGTEITADCRCELIFLNAAQVIEERLHREKMMVA